MPEQVESKPVRLPSPDHPITIEQNPSRVLVWAGGNLIADTRDALTLREASYPPVEYIPIEDVDRSLLVETDHSTYCPYKGDCNYYSITDRLASENAVWEYRDPYPAVARIKGRVAFYPDRVGEIEQRAEDQ
jgi:uncharacterized protein (DUF427 family)